MLGCRTRPEKDIWQHFAPPRWQRSSPQWLQLDQELPADHLARVIDSGVDGLDLTSLVQTYSGRGSKPCRPDLMLKMVLFEIQRGRCSPAQWHLDAKESTVLQWLGCGIRPARSVWYEFAFRIRLLIDEWLSALLHRARDQGLSAKRCALDGTALEANASRYRLFNREQLQTRRQTLDAAIAADERGDTPSEQPYWMAKTAATRRWQSAQYERTQTALDKRLAENQQRIPSQRQEEKNIRINVADPEAPLGKDKHRVFRPLYNMQYARDVDSPFILGYGVFARSSDVGTFVPMMTRTQQLTGQRPEIGLVDCGYITALDLADAAELGVELYGPWKENDYSNKDSQPAKQFGKAEFHWDKRKQEYRCPARQPLPLAGEQNRERSLGRTEKIQIYRADAATCSACPLKARCCPKSKSGRNLSRSEHEELIEAHRRKMDTPEAKAIYKLRRQTVETSFGDSKQHRNFRRVNGRGLLKAKIHAGLTVLAHNLVAFAKWVVGANSSEAAT